MDLLPCACSEQQLPNSSSTYAQMMIILLLLFVMQQLRDAVNAYACSSCLATAAVSDEPLMRHCRLSRSEGCMSRRSSITRSCSSTTASYRTNCRALQPLSVMHRCACCELAAQRKIVHDWLKVHPSSCAGILACKCMQYPFTRQADCRRMVAMNIVQKHGPQAM